MLSGVNLAPVGLYWAQFVMWHTSLLDEAEEAQGETINGTWRERTFALTPILIWGSALFWTMKLMLTEVENEQDAQSWKEKK